MTSNEIISRLEKYMTDKNKSFFEMSVDFNIHQPTISRWFRKKNISPAYRIILNNMLTERGY